MHTRRQRHAAKHAEHPERYPHRYAVGDQVWLKPDWNGPTVNIPVRITAQKRATANPSMHGTVRYNVKVMNGSKQHIQNIGEHKLTAQRPSAAEASTQYYWEEVNHPSGGARRTRRRHRTTRKA